VIVKIIQVVKRDSEQVKKLLKEEFQINLEKEYFHCNDWTIIALPRFAYDIGAIKYSEYDGCEWFEVDKNLLNIYLAKQKLEEIINSNIDNELYKKIKEINEILVYNPEKNQLD